jgi:hypothetical protein
MTIRWQATEDPPSPSSRLGTLFLLRRVRRRVRRSPKIGSSLTRWEPEEIAEQAVRDRTEKEML